MEKNVLMTTLVNHSPNALQRYMTDISISAEELTKKIGLKSKIEKAVSSDFPVFKLSELEKVANALYVPTIYLSSDELAFKPDLPKIVDYRKQENISTAAYKYKSIIRSAANTREDFIYVLNAMNEQPKDFHLKLTGCNPVDDANLIRDYFGLNETKGRTTRGNDYYPSWRRIIEQKDILVLEVDREVGSDGLCLYYENVPVIVIFSAGQSPARRLFTLIHELVHLGLNQSVFDGKMLSQNQLEIERYCDAVTGYVIAPDSLLKSEYDQSLSVSDLVEKIRKIAKASRPAIAIQLMLTSYISKEELNEYLEKLDYLRDKTFSNDSSPMIPASTRIVSHFGRSFVQSVLSAMWNNNISATTAKQILGVKDTHKSYTLKKINDMVFS